MKLNDRDLYWEKDASDSRGYLVLGREWDSAVQSAVEEAKPDSLYLNYTRGWKGSLDFLSEIPYLKRLKIIAEDIDSLEVIEKLAGLEHLLIQGKCRTAPDFSKLRCLKECVLDWIPGFESVFGCRSLRCLYLDGYPARDCSQLASLDKLISLSLVGCVRLSSIQELSGLDCLGKLTLIKLPKLSEADAIGRIPKLEYLYIQTCKSIHSFDFLLESRKLRTLCLVNLGKIGSLDCLRKCIDLTHLDFTDSTCIVDGDLNVLMRLPKLKTVYFQNRKHYTHKAEDFR